MSAPAAWTAPIAAPSALPIAPAPNVFVPSPSAASFEPELAPRRRRGRAIGWTLGIAGLMGLFVVLYRTHTLLAAARVLSLEGRYLGIERAVQTRLGFLTHGAQGPSVPATTVVGANTIVRPADPGSTPARVEPAPSAAAAAEVPSPPASSNSKAEAAAETQEPAPADSPGTKTAGSRASKSGRTLRTASVRKGKSAPEASEDEEAPKSRSSQTVSLDEDEEEAPKSLWPAKPAKTSAKSESTKSDSKGSAEPPKVESKLDDAIRAVSQGSSSK